jgi:ubiquinone/menaquinone biosynthesis C-methylase UbiE
MSSIDKFYENQEKGMTSALDPDRIAVAETWMNFDNNTLDGYRNRKHFFFLEPFITHCPQTRWLTVGDGRYGSDANYLIKKGFSVVATDIQDDLLKIGHEKGFIKEYSKENAEKLTFQSESFDYVLCKEAYHHFPRPAIGVYEMLRVAKIAVLLCEPKDLQIPSGPASAVFESLKRALRKLMGARQTGDDYEPSGNYVYALSVRELEKYALGLNLPAIAYQVSQDHYIPGSEFEPFTNASKMVRKWKTAVKIKEVLYKLGLYNGGMMTAMIFKIEPDAKLLLSMKAQGFTIKHLSRNPYIK